MWKSWWLEKLNKSHLLHSQAYNKKMRNYNPLEKNYWASPSRLDGARSTMNHYPNWKWISNICWKEKRTSTFWPCENKRKLCTNIRMGFFRPLNPSHVPLTPGGEKRVYACWKNKIHAFVKILPLTLKVFQIRHLILTCVRLCCTST